MQAFTTLADIERLEQTPREQTAPHRSPYALIRATAERFPEREAFRFLPDADLATEPRRISYRALVADIHRAANLFRSLGVGPDDAVALLAPNLPRRMRCSGARSSRAACVPSTTCCSPITSRPC